MKPNELRIGNYIEWFGKIDRVKIIDESAWISPEPIPLTEEWLLKFGFEIEEHENGNTLKMEFSIKSGGYKSILELTNKGSIESPMLFTSLNSNYGKYFPLTSDIEYVHQLQNLYFALTGEEIKEIS